ncbi:MAG: AlbA family DNA-binding domain-containing protein [Candidatus Dormibacteria bacterium]
MDGASALGCKVEVNGATYRVAKRVGKTGKVRLPLPHGLPDDSWLYLSRGTRWLDYRAIGDRVRSRGDLAKAGVTVEVPRDPESDLEAMIATGECATIEFKEQMPGDHKSKQRLFKTVAAFANGRGGTLLVGVTDSGVPVGLDPTTIEVARTRLNDFTRAIVVPTPEFEIRRVKVGSKALLVLEVGAGSDHPYGIHLEHNGPVEYYIRRNGSSFHATPDEVRALARGNLGTAAAQAGPLAYLGGSHLIH